MDMEVINKEQRILRQVQKTLGNIVKDVAPAAGRPNPLTNTTMQDIKDCFGLISEREKELTGKFNKVEPTKSNSADSKQTGSSTLSFVKLPKR